MDEQLQLTEIPVRPFSTGSQYADWQDKNCFDCLKGTLEGDYKCALQEAIDFAYLDEGIISAEFARRIGVLDNEDRYCWRCPEKEISVDSAEYRHVYKQAVQKARGKRG